ncbi:uncharacterized protein [Anoplolepis gracilipes]
MKGFGKSSLTANALKDAILVKKLFTNQIYWIKFTCDGSVDEEILIQLNVLYHNIKNLEIQPNESFTPLQKEPLIRYFKSYFGQQDNCNALLILDDVSNKKIINAFDFECKTLVLTADINVLQGKKFKKIEMNDGFTETETLGLFAKVLEMDVDKLPIEAKRIHEECKGMPLLIAMFAAQFKEFKYDMRIHSDRWRYYLQSLRKKDAKNKVIREFFKKQETIFDMCIGQLKPNLKEYYKSLAIFKEDVNITSKTLAILWEEDIHHVDDLMLDLCHKSLVAKKWNKDLKCYIYGVHDLLLCHLRTKLTQNELTQLHKSVIEKYREHCNNDFSKLPDDNYIYSYIGHHLEQAKLFEEFPKLYLDFSFIQAKIMHSGLTDLLLDFKKYKRYITYHYNNEAEVFDIERFLQEQANIIVEHRRKKCLDIIQIAMNYPYQGYVTETAKQLAMKKGNYLYLSHDKTLEHVNVSLIHEMSTDICTSSFTDHSNLILIGNASGKIILWNSESMQQQIFNGHNEEYPITKLVVSKDGDCFLSLSSAGIVKLFLLRLSDEEFEPNDQNCMPVESPRQKQSSWSDIFINNNRLDDSVAEFSIPGERILDVAFGYNDQYVAACTDKSKIQMWNRMGELILAVEKEFAEVVTKIAFTNQSSLLHVIDESEMAFTVYFNDDDTYRYLACYNLKKATTSRKVIFFHQVPNRNWLMIVTEKEAICVKWCWDGDITHSFSKQKKVFIENSCVTYVCATITYDGEYMIMADSAGFINVWQTSVGYPIVAIYKSRVTSLDTYCLEEEGCHIICGNGNKLFYKWKFPTRELNKRPKKCLFDAIVKPYDETDITVKECQLKKIIISYGEDTIELESKGKIVNLQLSPGGNEIIYITDTGTITLYDITTRTSNFSLDMKEHNIFLKIINICNFNVIICGWSSNNTMMIQNSEGIFTLTNKLEGCIIDVYKLDDNHVAIITQNDIQIWFWTILTETSELIPKLIRQLPLKDSKVLFSCFRNLSNKTYLAILNESCQLILHCLYSDRTVLESPCKKIQFYFIYTFSCKTTCCDISQNEQYIAVGTEKGEIFIIDIENRTVITQLSFHKDPITQLFWAPIADVPILLSVANNELVWWNIALTKNNTRKSRMGIRHSISTPSLSLNSAFQNLKMRPSRSIDTNVSNLQNNNASEDAISIERNNDGSDITVNTVRTVSEYWINKKGRDPEMPELLAVVELPPNPYTKLHVSTDFTKFITIDMYGSISTFKLIDFAGIQIVN